MMWRIAPFNVVNAWAMAVMLGWMSWTASLGNSPNYAIVSMLTALFMLGFTYWKRRQIQKAGATFDLMVEEYERAISEPVAW
jgi:ABC-type transport system involved in cytochrome bd biosynthesis fused ATPase/permease subunit